MNKDSIELRVKAKHLALEPAIIRKEEKKLQRQVSYHLAKLNEPNVQWGWFNSEDETKKAAYRLNNKRGQLQYHRQDRNHNGLRTEARATNLARAFISGKRYGEVEKNRRPEAEYGFQQIVIPRVAKMVMKYGHNRLNEQKAVDIIRDWVDKG